MRDTVQSMSAGPLAHHGKHFRMPAAVHGAPAQTEAVAVLPRPLQATIPIWMAAFSNVSVKRAARLGYPLLPAAHVTRRWRLAVLRDDQEPYGRESLIHIDPPDAPPR
jgi:alkanesulfonate monooxygenase SsuD/methylene tetrahydromethanopterin reductase-like flavin-dependent oxidoreductase (luciferase family)